MSRLILIVPRLGQDFRAKSFPRPNPPSRTVGRGVTRPEHPPVARGNLVYSPAAFATSTVTPGPMVEDSAIFWT